MMDYAEGNVYLPKSLMALMLYRSTKKKMQTGIAFFPCTVREWNSLAHTPFAVKANSHTFLLN